MDNVEIQVTRTVFWRKKNRKVAYIYVWDVYFQQFRGTSTRRQAGMHALLFLLAKRSGCTFFFTFENIQHCLCKNRWKCQTVKQMSWPIPCDINKRSFYVWRQDPFWLSRLHTESSVFLFCFFLRWKRSLGQVTSLVTLGRLNGLRYPRSRYKER